MTDLNGYVRCGEVFRSPVLCNEKAYIFKCIQCQDIFQLQAFLTHTEQNVCGLQEVCIKEEIIDDELLPGCSQDKNVTINSSIIDSVEIKQESVAIKSDENVSNADDKITVRYEMESSDADVPSDQKEYETDVSLPYELDDDSEVKVINAAEEIDNLTLPPKHGNEVSLAAEETKRQNQRKHMVEYRKKKKTERKLHSIQERLPHLPALVPTNTRAEYHRKYMIEYRKRKKEESKLLASGKYPLIQQQKLEARQIAKERRRQKERERKRAEYRRKRGVQADLLAQQEYPIDERQAAIQARRLKQRTYMLEYRKKKREQAGQQLLPQQQCPIQQQLEHSTQQQELEVCQAQQQQQQLSGTAKL